MDGSLVTLGDRVIRPLLEAAALSAGSRQMKPNPYDSECSSRRALERIGGKWSILIVNLLRERTMRFAELLRWVDGTSQGATR
jgi:hypothetical protein